MVYYTLPLTLEPIYPCRVRPSTHFHPCRLAKASALTHFPEMASNPSGQPPQLALQHYIDSMTAATAF